MSKTNIEWTGHTWNPLSGCTKASDGCKNGFAVTLHPEKLDEPLKRKKPTMYFVCSMGDLFHEDVPFEFIGLVFSIIIQNPQHTFQILTKRPERMKKYIEYEKSLTMGLSIEHIKNVWLGVTAENQEQADKRIPVLLDTPAALRFVSIEPMIGAINLTKLEKDMSDGTRYGYKMNGLTGVGYEYMPDSSHEWKWAKLDWVIVGGETGANARPMHPDWVRSIQKQCETEKVPFFFKQWGEYKTLPQGKSVTGYKSHFWEDGRQAVRVGKKQAGHLLDGVEYREMPEVKKRCRR